MAKNVHRAIWMKRKKGIGGRLKIHYKTVCGKRGPFATEEEFNETPAKHRCRLCDKKEKK